MIPRDVYSSDRSPKYMLAPHVHGCRADAHVVLLDVKRDKYLGVDGQTADFLGTWIADWPIRVQQGMKSLAVESDATESGMCLLAQLLELGMLTLYPGGQVTRRSAIPAAATELIAPADCLEPRVTASDVWAFTTSIVRARLLMGFKSFEEILLRCRARASSSAGRAVGDAAVDEFDLDYARERVGTFELLTPLLFSSYNRCLFTSLALSEFLAHSRLFPQVIFGVLATPFEAHCWLQYRGVVLNDTLEHVRAYVPIMSV
jgi:hypothetical protein